MKKALISLLAATIFAVVLAPIPAQAQTPVCANGDQTDPDGDGWGWENGQSCIVADEPAAAPTPAPAPAPPADTGCDYSDAHHNGGWGWNSTTGTSCPPNNTQPQTDAPTSAPAPSPPPAPASTADTGCDYSEAHHNGGWGWNSTTGTSCPPNSTQPQTAPEPSSDPAPTPNPEPAPDPAPAGDRHPSYAEAIGVLFPSASTAVRTQLTDALWKAHARAQASDDSQPSVVRDFHNLLLANGFDPVYSKEVRVGNTPHDELPITITEVVPVEQVDPVDANNQQAEVNQINQKLVASVARAAGPEKLAAIIPGYPLQGGTDPGEVEVSLGTFGGSSSARADRFAANSPQLAEMLDELPNPPKSASQVERIEILAFEQANLLLDIRPTNRRLLWQRLIEINEGIFPTIEVENRTGFITQQTTTQFSRLWNASTTEERIAYYGFDPTGWELAKPYIELSLEMDRIQDALEDVLGPLVMLFVGAVLGAITGGLASSAYAAYFGVSASSFGAVAAGATVGAYTTTFFLTGSTSQAEKGAWRALLTSGLTHYANIPIGERTTTQVFSVAILEGGIASLDGGSFRDTLLAALAKHYVPGVASFVEELDNTSPFLTELGEVLIHSYIETDGDWGRISDDLERFVLGEAGAHVTDFVDGRLSASWGTVGSSVGQLAGIAVASGGDEATIHRAVASQLGALTNQGVGNLLGDGDSWVANLTGELTTGYLLSLERPAGQRAQFIDQHMTTYVFDLAANSLSNTARDRMVSANGGQPSALINAATGLLRVTIANLWRDGDDLEQVLLNQFATELRTAIASTFPECAPEWLTGLGDQMIAVVLNSAASGNADTINADLAALVNRTAATGQLEGGIGTCHQAAGGNGDGDSSGTTCTNTGVVPLTAPTGTEFCAEDGTKIYMHPLGLWAVDGTNEIRSRDNDGIPDGNGVIVEVPASVAAPPHPIVLLVFALGAAFKVAMQSPTSDGVTITEGSRQDRYAHLDDAWEAFPDSYFTELSADDIAASFSQRSGSGNYVEYYELNQSSQRIRLAILADDTALLQLRQGFFGDWVNTNRQYTVRRGGPSGQSVVSFDAVDNSPRGLENRTAGLPLGLTTSSSRARAISEADNRDGDWQAHHLIPVQAIIAYQDMFDDAIEFGLSEASRPHLMSRGVLFTDAVNNLIVLPANTETQRKHRAATGQCLPVHNGHSYKHQRWDDDAVFGFDHVTGVDELHDRWFEQTPPGSARFWNQWALDVLELQEEMRERIKRDTADEIGCRTP